MTNEGAYRLISALLEDTAVVHSKARADMILGTYENLDDSEYDISETMSFVESKWFDGMTDLISKDAMYKAFDVRTEARLDKELAREQRKGIFRDMLALMPLGRLSEDDILNLIVDASTGEIGDARTRAIRNYLFKIMRAGVLSDAPEALAASIVGKSVICRTGKGVARISMREAGPTVSQVLEAFRKVGIKCKVLESDQSAN